MSWNIYRSDEEQSGYDAYGDRHNGRNIYEGGYEYEQGWLEHAREERREHEREEERLMEQSQMEQREMLEYQEYQNFIQSQEQDYLDRQENE